MSLTRSACSVARGCGRSYSNQRGDVPEGSGSVQQRVDAAGLGCPNPAHSKGPALALAPGITSKPLEMFCLIKSVWVDLGPWATAASPR